MGVDHPGLGFSLQDLVRMVRREALAALQNSSIGRAGLRFYDGGKALFQGGGGVEIQDTGYIIINGSLTGLGEFNWEGTFVQTGQSTFTGPTTFTGTINATGNTAWSGIMSIVGDIVILPGGRLVVGNMIIDPTSNGGSVKFSGGPEVYASGAELSLYSGGGGSFVTLSPTMAKVNGPGARWIEVNSAGIRMAGLPTIARSSANNAVVGTLWADGSGNVYRVV